MSFTEPTLFKVSIAWNIGTQSLRVVQVSDLKQFSCVRFAWNIEEQVIHYLEQLYKVR